MLNSKQLKRVGVYTKNEYLFQKIRLEFSGLATVLMLSEEDFSVDCDLTLVNLDEPEFCEKEGIKMSSHGAEIDLPFRIGALVSFLEKSDSALIKDLPSEKAVILNGERVKLTELEYLLFSLLYSRGGSFVSREEILDSIWNGKADKGILNVYIHYLREKLEKNGEKIIISSRNYGYKINEKYLGEKDNA